MTSSARSETPPPIDGLIVGEVTFGKGLVQTVYPLSENTGLALTTAKYYTPSGRLIQRDYAHTSFYNYYYRKDTETKNPLDVKMTDSGRTVYGGGGISPDEKFVAPKLNKFQTEMYRKYSFFNFAAHYFLFAKVFEHHRPGPERPDGEGR